MALSPAAAADESSERSVRALAEDYALVAVLVMSVLVIYAVTQLRERPEFQNRVQGSPIKAFRDIWHNPHARL